MTPEFFDAHSHINLSDYGVGQADVLARMKEAYVWTTVVGVDLEKSKEAVNLAEANEGVFACIGVHPADDIKAVFDENAFEKLVAHPKVVAVGECGLDYFRLTGDLTTEKKRQKDLFEKQIQFAIDHKKLLMIHCRDAYEDATDILESYAKRYGDKLWGNAHFFAGGVAIGKRLLEINFSLSFTGVITFTKDYDEVVRMTPIDMIMSETDSPFVAPVPFRGERNSPVYVKYVAEKIAEIRGEDLETVKKALVMNALNRFQLQ
jgi:TatD DNase family protein